MKTYFINTETLEVEEFESSYNVLYDKKYRELEHDPKFVKYPFIFEVERYKLLSENGQDYETEIQIRNLLQTDLEEVIKDLQVHLNRYKTNSPSYDYFIFEEESLYIDENCTEPFLVPYGCYNPSKERALAWYLGNQEKIKKDAEHNENYRKAKIEQLEKEIAILKIGMSE